MVTSAEQVSADPEQILYDAVDRCEPLEMGGRLESTHLVLTLPYRLMRDLGSIVFVLPGTVDHGRHHGTMRGRVAAEFVCDQPARLGALSLQQLAEEPCGRPPIAPQLHENVEDIAVLVHGTPQILLPPLDLHEKLVQIPRVAHAAPAAPQPPSVVEPERPTAGWPREITLPGLPQIRTCPIRASGSSVYGLAARRYMLWTTRGGARG